MLGGGRSGNRRDFANRCAALLLFFVAALLPAAAAAQPLKVMSFNVRLPIASDGPNAWSHRRDLAVRTVREAAPDVIGTQELFKEQGDYLVEKLPHYAWIGEGRRGGTGDEHMGLFYRRDRLRLLQSGNFWFSDTPAVPGSIHWGNLYPRMVTWAQFKAKLGRTFFVFNTHFPYRAEDEPIRRRAAAFLAARIRDIAGTAPVVITGDFNTGPDSEAHALLTRDFADAWTASRSRAGPPETFHNFTGTADRRIDWILTRGFTVRGVRTVTDHEGAAYPSDHFPVLAELRWR
ncbi:MAG: endonuclease/exonuclease/phosphatase family protein [Sphingomonadales bacterium]|nr:MAG: endonuclease/exonuclease/phosphatase family protein [Sphingomonadales bacterium]